MSFNEFTAPLTPGEIEWKIQGYTKDKSKTTIVPYIDARACFTRLDQCFGPQGWYAKYEPLHTGKEDGFLCTLGIYTETHGFVDKQDGSGCTDIEPVKGGISGAFKRACHAWGLGRELYSYPKIFIVGEQKHLHWKLLKRLDSLVDAFNAGKIDRNLYTLNPDGTNA